MDLGRAKWRGYAKCVIDRVPPKVFYPDRGDSWGRQAAKDICGACVVQPECLAQAMAQESEYPGRRYGIRAGLTNVEREKYWQATLRLLAFMASQGRMPLPQYKAIYGDDFLELEDQ